MKNSYFRKLKVRANRLTHEVTLHIPLIELRSLLTLAALQAYASDHEARQSEDLPAVKQERLAYYRGIINYIQGIERLIAVRRGDLAYGIKEDPLTVPQSVETRRFYVEHAKKERRLIDGLLDGLLEANGRRRARQLAHEED